MACGQQQRRRRRSMRQFVQRRRRQRSLAVCVRVCVCVKYSEANIGGDRTETDGLTRAQPGAPPLRFFCELR